MCISFIAKNFENLTTKSSDFDEPKYVWRFLHPDCFIPTPIAEQLLQKLGKEKILRAEYLNLFSAKYAELKSVDLRHSDLTPSSLDFLSNFTLYSLRLVELRCITLTDIIRRLSQETRDNLMALHLSYVTVKVSGLTNLRLFSNLKFINFSQTRLNNCGLATLVGSVPQLLFLDISNTWVSDIYPLGNLNRTLRSLAIRKLNIYNAINRFLMTLLKLKKLRFLDISYLESRYFNPEQFERYLCSAQKLPNLEHFLMNGNPFGLSLTHIK